MIPTTASVDPGRSGRSARRAVEPLGELDDQAFGSADVAEEEVTLPRRQVDLLAYRDRIANEVLAREIKLGDDLEITKT